MFCAISNEGRKRTNIPTPARLDHVFRIGAASGSGYSYENNPTHEFTKEKFSTLGIGVRGCSNLTCSVIGPTTSYSCEIVEGTSYATSIAAGIAALLLEMVLFEERWPPPLFGRGELFGYIRKIFLEISQGSSDDDYLFLRPWTLVEPFQRMDWSAKKDEVRGKLAEIRNMPPGLFQLSLG